MGLLEDMTRRGRKFDIIDVTLAQGTSMFSALVIVKLIPGITDLNIWWFVGLTILCYLKPFYVFWFEE